MKERRFEKIIKLLEENDFVKVDEISKILNISLATVRRDLTELEKRGLIKRLRGAAKIINNLNAESVDTNFTRNMEEKTKIARFAASLVNDGESIFMDAGSTTFQMIKYLRNKDVLVVTNGINLVAELVANDIRCLCLGGTIKPNTKAIVGDVALDMLEKFYFDKVFIGANAVSFENGCSTPDMKEAKLKKVSIEKSRVGYILADKTKFDKSCFVKFAELDTCKIITSENIAEYKEFIVNID